MSETNGTANRIGNITSNVSNISGYLSTYLKKSIRDVYSLFSDNGVRTTVSSTRWDTAKRGINQVLFVTAGALTSVTDTKGYVALSSAIDSGTTSRK